MKVYPPFFSSFLGLLLLAGCFALWPSCFLDAQTLPVADSPANGSAWEYVGPHQPPAPGKGASWGSTGTGAQVRVRFFDNQAANPADLYAATPTGGLFRTRNVLDSLPVWENLTDSTRLPVLGVRAFAFSPGDPNTIFVGTGIRYPLDIRRSYGIGLLKTTDGGRTWQPTGLQFQPPGSMAEVAHDVLPHPSDPDTLHVLCGKDYYRSDDGGDHFSLKKTLEYPCPAGWERSFRMILPKPGSPHRLYLTADAGYFFWSNNSGETWQEVALDSSLGVTEPVMRVDMAVSQRNPDLLYLGISGKRNEFILRSLDSGRSWRLLLQKNLSSSYEKHVFAISPNDDNTLYVGGLYVYEVKVFPDGKVNSKQITASNVHLDHREICVVADGQGGDIIYSANDGGLYRAVFDGKKWQWRDVSGRGFNNMQFYGIAVAEDYSVMPGGTQDLGTMLIRPDGRSTKPSLGGDGTDCAVDPYNPANLFSISWALGPAVIFKSNDGGDNWKQWRKGMINNGDTYYHPLIFHENGHLYAGTTKVQHLPYGSDTWLQIGDIQLPTKDPWRVTAMAVSSDANTIYAYGDQLYKTENAGADSLAVWAALGEKLGDAGRYYHPLGGHVMAIEVDDGDADRVWVGLKTFTSPNKVYFSEDGGDTWRSVSEGLPPFPVTALAFQAGTEGVLYAGTDVGMFVNPDAGNPASAWQPFNAGLPVCLVTDLEMNYCQGKIVAGTFGRGIWASPFAVPSVFEPVETARSETWSYRIFRSDVVVKAGTTLTLQGEVRLASGKKITVEAGATLVLDGAHVSGLCGTSDWGGIEEEASSAGFLGLFFKKPAGSILFKNGATVDLEPH